MESIIQRSTNMFALLFQIQKPCQHLGRVFGCHFWIKLSSIPLTNVWAGKQHELIPKKVKICLTNERFDWVAHFFCSFGDRDLIRGFRPMERGKTPTRMTSRKFANEQFFEKLHPKL